MREKLNDLGGDINQQNVDCRRCHTSQSGGFDPVYGIRICTNNIRNQGHLEDTLAHGMSGRLPFGSVFMILSAD